MKHVAQRSHSHRRWWLFGVIVGIIVALGGLFWYQQTKSTNPRPQTMHFVALGDSLTQGIGYADDHTGYLPALSSQLKQDYRVTLKTHNFGIGGLRSDQIDERIKTNQEEQQAIRRAQLIAITAGGNDLLQSLQSNITVDDDQKLVQKLKPAKATYEARLTRLLSRLKQLNPKAQIYLFGFYNPVYVYFANATAITRAVNDWTAVNKTVAQKTARVTYVDINNVLSRGQFTSKKAQDKLVKEGQKASTSLRNPESADAIIQATQSGEKNHYLSQHDHFHPNQRGYTLMARQLASAVAKVNHWTTK
ncbi:GDSL-type esterase/lipase family protein [Secundilactobacillus kimchicus]|uniref:GDSL-type esterase/lipase family protein n=1 Tax=Secundilactobacillus kimchicus TaxID=528209 RepID=UPI0024A9BB6D|nr:GDSL-type esterase/lipase family protein [Secundilactobacillus kimchicus]